MICGITDLLSHYLMCNKLCIDSRKVAPGDFFVSLKGDHADGNQYAKEAIERGAKFALIDDASYQISDQYLLVEDALSALQNMAIEYRKSLTNLVVIAVAGSNGKTTTKELVFHALSKTYKTHCTVGNFNNHIGVPLSILNCNPDTEIAVIEIGANHLGEHTELCKIAQPTHGIVTNCGKDHLEGYGSVDGVIESNNELYHYLRLTNGHAFVNSDDALLLNLSAQLSRTCYGSIGSLNNITYNILSLYPKLAIEAKTEGGAQLTMSSHLYGAFQAINIAAALSVGEFFKVPLTQIVDAIENYLPTNNRSQTLEWNGNTILLDAYNANPSSVAGIIDYFKGLNCENKVIILGDMAELGKASFSEHKNITESLKSFPNSKIILVGKEYQPFINELDCQFFSQTSDLKHYFKEEVPFQNATVLVKGSRRHSLESLFLS